MGDNLGPKAPLAVCLALIHNNDARRTPIIRESVAALASKLAETRRVESVEISYQGVFELHAEGAAFRREVRYRILEYRWQKYRLLKPSLCRHLRRGMKDLLKKYVFARDASLERWRRDCAVETIVADKHVRAWDRFLESECDVLLCFEDDAVFRRTSFDDAAEALSLFETLMAKNEHVYADLAGGVAVSALRLDRLRVTNDSFATHYAKMVTNTACAYALSRGLAADFRSILTDKPGLRLVAVDWMLNRLLMELERAGIRGACFHTEPPIVDHGSFTGAFEPWRK